MKKLLATLFIMLPVIATGQTQPKGEIVNLIGMCVNQFQFAETMSSYGELPFLTMTTMRPTDETMQNYEEYPTVLFMNPNTLTWTLAEKRGENKYCVTGVGQNTQPYVNDPANMRQGT